MTDPTNDIPDPDWDGPGGDAARAGEYVLGLLPEAEVRAFEDRLRIEPDLRRLVAGWEEHLVALTDDIDPVDAPARVWKAVEAQVFAGTEASQPWWRRFGIGQAAFGGLVTAGFVWLAVSFGWLLPDTPEVRVLAELTGDSRVYTALVSVEPASHTLILDRSTGAPAEGRDHELWLIVGEAAPVSLGVLPRDGQARIVLDDATAAVLDGAVLAVSDEPLGGSTTGAPTGDVLALVAVALG